MSRLSNLPRYIGGKPELIIEVILASVLLIFALYVGGPWYVGGPTTAIGTAIEREVVRFFTAVVYAVPALVTFFGIKSPKMRGWGVFGMFLAYLFSTILRLLTFGPFPMIWLFIFGLCLISAVLYIVESRRDDE